MTPPDDTCPAQLSPLSRAAQVGLVRTDTAPPPPRPDPHRYNRTLRAPGPPPTLHRARTEHEDAVFGMQLGLQQRAEPLEAAQPLLGLSARPAVPLLPEAALRVAPIGGGGRGAPLHGDGGEHVQLPACIC